MRKRAVYFVCFIYASLTRRRANHACLVDDDDMGMFRPKPRGDFNKDQNNLFKTKMCNLYLAGTCRKGKDCHFAHSEEELRKKPTLFKTKMCHAFAQGGTCSKGQSCNFAHGEEELRSMPDLYKTALCNQFSQGKCQLGDKCKFAHGVEELRSKPSHAKPRNTGNTHSNRFHGGQNQSNPMMPSQNTGYNQYFNSQPFSAPTFSYPMQSMPSNFQGAPMMGGYFMQGSAAGYPGYQNQ